MSLFVAKLPFGLVDIFQLLTFNVLVAGQYPVVLVDNTVLLYLLCDERQCQNLLCYLCASSNQPALLTGKAQCHTSRYKRIDSSILQALLLQFSKLVSSFLRDRDHTAFSYSCSADVSFTRTILQYYTISCISTSLPACNTWPAMPSEPAA